MPPRLSFASGSLSWLNKALGLCPNQCVCSHCECSPGKDSRHLKGTSGVSIQAQLNTCVWHPTYSFCRLPEEMDRSHAYISQIMHCIVANHPKLRNLKGTLLK